MIEKNVEKCPYTNFSEQETKMLMEPKTRRFEF